MNENDVIWRMTVIIASTMVTIFTLFIVNDGYIARLQKEIDKVAIEKGLCQIQDSGRSNYPYYHWDKCR